MNVQKFINKKAKQLPYFIRGFWDNKIPFKELDLYFWDTMEEWAQIENRDEEPISQKERVFWHVLHQIHFWSEGKLQNDTYLRDELDTCLDYLEGIGVCPLDCVGIRP